MKIRFHCYGMVFDAEVTFTPGTDDYVSGPADDWCPGDDAEIEFESLTVCETDASFLLDSTIADDIVEEALRAAYEADDGEYDDRDSYDD